MCYQKQPKAAYNRCARCGRCIKFCKRAGCVWSSPSRRCYTLPTQPQRAHSVNVSHPAEAHSSRC
eukprot:scaffold275581_cov23-Tisochrysis_lutea.AAC.1